jgi:uncharacterized protein (DUF488 family)
MRHNEMTGNLISRRRMTKTIYTVGHSTHTIDAFVEMLNAHGIEQIADVRTVPRSRHNPQYNKETLPKTLRTRRIRYIHMPGLGGLRKPKRDSINTAWENASFRGFADYMQTRDFASALMQLTDRAREKATAIMCAEAVPWRCHRSLIAYALTLRKFKVVHIMSATNSREHTITPFAHVEGRKITYPIFSPRTSPSRPRKARIKRKPLAAAARRPRGKPSPISR